jgi:hypothetical protein
MFGPLFWDSAYFSEAVTTLRMFGMIFFRLILILTRCGYGIKIWFPSKKEKVLLSVHIKPLNKTMLTSVLLGEIEVLQCV